MVTSFTRSDPPRAVKGGVGIFPAGPAPRLLPCWACAWANKVQCQRLAEVSCGGREGTGQSVWLRAWGALGSSQLPAQILLQVPGILALSHLASTGLPLRRVG